MVGRAYDDEGIEFLGRAEGGHSDAETRRLKQLEAEENGKLRKQIAYVSLDKETFQVAIHDEP
ncbi:hypothetical protein ABGN05_27175 [Aquibium sp. LZ166]|uniref:Transposase n=1 Tax=Aquibium pacificus TaxID=3153579 RepID=A0ABV3STV5_9HYPH